MMESKVSEVGESSIPNSEDLTSLSSKLGSEDFIEGSTDQCAESVDNTLEGVFEGDWDILFCR